ncbi:MAG: DUF2318 domain-containing protein [Acutalibacteraceae bacterium]
MTKRNNSFKAVQIMSIVIILMLTLFAFSGCSVQKNETENVASSAGSVTSSDSSESINAGENLVIPLSAISESIDFYSFEVDGTEMEILAAKDSDGTIRMAFNTCQVCNGSRLAYFEKSGDYVVCQNCKNKFSLSQVGITSGGCNPYPILSQDRTQTADSIELSYDFLTANKALFATWKNN